MVGSQSTESGEYDEQILVREVYANGICMRTTEVEAKLDEGNIQEAECSLREGLSLNFEVLFLEFILLATNFSLEFISVWPRIVPFVNILFFFFLIKVAASENTSNSRFPKLFLCIFHVF